MKKKFKPAFNGLKLCVLDHSIRLQLIIACVVIGGCLIVGLTIYQWVMVISAIAFVIVSEVINTCIEKLCDLIDANYNESIKTIKDLGAGAVLIASIYAVIIALIIGLMKLGVI